MSALTSSLFSFTNRDEIEVRLTFAASPPLRRAVVPILADAENSILQLDPDAATPIVHVENVDSGEEHHNNVIAHLSQLPNNVSIVAFMLSAGTEPTSADQAYRLEWTNAAGGSSEPLAISIGSTISPVCLAAIARHPETQQWQLTPLGLSLPDDDGSNRVIPATEKLGFIRNALRQRPATAASPASNNPPRQQQQQQQQQGVNDDDDDDVTSGNRHIPVSALTDSTEIIVGASWDDVKGQAPCDLDLSALAINARGQICERIFWGKLQGLDGRIEHSGDSVDGVGSGDDEAVTVFPRGIADDCVAIFFLLSNYNGNSLTEQHNIRVRVLERQAQQRGGPAVRIDRGEMHRRFVQRGGAAAAKAKASHSECFAAMVRKPNRSVNSGRDCVGAPWSLVEMARSVVGVDSVLDAAWQDHTDIFLNAALNPTPIPSMGSAAAAATVQPAAAASAAASLSAPPQRPPMLASPQQQQQQQSQSESDTLRRRGRGGGGGDQNKSAAPSPLNPHHLAQQRPQQQQQQRVDETYQMYVYLIIAALIILLPLWLAL